MNETTKERIASQFIQSLPHSMALGMRLTSIGEGEAEIQMDYDERLVGDPATGVILRDYLRFIDTDDGGSSSGSVGSRLSESGSDGDNDDDGDDDNSGSGGGGDDDGGDDDGDDDD